MTDIRADVVVVGSGFAGSICAMLLDRIGCKVVLVDRQSHPRFAIGESSTPAADFVLADLAREYDLPRLLPLSQYGTMRAAYPELNCGRKRGFSYFQHTSGQPFQQCEDRSNELLVAASSDDQVCDSHWYRPDLDSFLFHEAKACEIDVFEDTLVSVRSDSPSWQMTFQQEESTFNVEAEFLIDASGAGQFISRHFQLADIADQLQTNTRCAYGHFRGVKPFHELLNHDGTTEYHPYRCDDAAVHHLLDKAWMWNLRFDNGITSAGIVGSGTEATFGQSNWDAALKAFPSVDRMFASAENVLPGGLVVSNRLQRLSSRIVGSNWAMLPTTAGFIDPLHSTGIAHALIGVERVVKIIQRSRGHKTFTDELTGYAKTVDAELRMIDRLVALCYQTLGQFDQFVASTMVYFAAVSTWEQQRRSGTKTNGFLLAEDEEFVRICQAVAHRQKTIVPDDDFTDYVRRAIELFNSVGLLSATANNMYSHTAAR